jgi:hypothetical protein
LAQLADRRVGDGVTHGGPRLRVKTAPRARPS